MIILPRWGIHLNYLNEFVAVKISVLHFKLYTEQHRTGRVTAKQQILNL
jgi:hypothetical protein